MDRSSLSLSRVSTVSVSVSVCLSQSLEALCGWCERSAGLFGCEGAEIKRLLQMPPLTELIYPDSALTLDGMLDRHLISTLVWQALHNVCPFSGIFYRPPQQSSIISLIAVPTVCPFYRSKTSVSIFKTFHFNILKCPVSLYGCSMCYKHSRSTLGV